MENEIKKLLEDVKNGSISIDDALLRLKAQPFEDIGYAKVDFHRRARQGAAEIIYGESKTPEQIIGIINSMLKNNQKRILITRLSDEKAELIKKDFDLEYFSDAKIGIIGGFPEAENSKKIVIATGGTSDIPVAEEAALTASFLGKLEL